MGSHLSTPPESARVFNALRRLVRFLRARPGAAGPDDGLSNAQRFVLVQLDAAPATSLRALAGRTMTDPSSVSVVVKKLVAAGLVARERDPADRRRASLSLTRAGRARLSRAPYLPQLRIVAALTAMSAERRATLAAALEELVAAIGVGAMAPRMFFEDEAHPDQGSEP